HLGKWRIIFRKLRLCRVDAIDNDFIQTQIRHENKSVVRRKYDLVRMRAALALRIDARPAVLDEIGRLAQHPAFEDRKHHHPPAPTPNIALTNHLSPSAHPKKERNTPRAPRLFKKP